MARRETPIPRINPSGEKVWTARWTDKTGKRRYGFPPDIKGTHRLKRDAQAAIDACYEREDKGPANPDTLGGYAATWTMTHPRARRTNATNESRVRAVLDVRIEGAPLRDWPLDRLKRKHANLLVGHLLTEQGRAREGALNIIRTLALMAEDAIDDEVMVANPFRGVKIRPNDPRIVKASKPIRVFGWTEMHEFARACARGAKGGEEIAAWRRVYAEPMVRTLSDLGLRAGELFPLFLSDLDLKAGTLRVERTESLGEILPGTKTDHGEENAGRVAPVPPELLAMLAVMPKRIDGWVQYRAVPGGPLVRGQLLFPSPRGKLWQYPGWWRDVWEPGREAAGMDIRPHEMRHSYVSLLRAAGVDVADLADVAGHTVETATKTYTHGLGRSFDVIKRAVGE